MTAKHDRVKPDLSGHVVSKLGRRPVSPSAKLRHEFSRDFTFRPLCRYRLLLPSRIDRGFDAKGQKMAVFLDSRTPIGG